MKAATKTEPKERPILFSSSMVKAILDGTKTQTRRIVNWKNVAKQTGCTKGTLAYSDTFNSWAVFNGNGEADLCLLDCPYGKPGDRLWVRESVRLTRADSDGAPLIEPPVWYTADGECPEPDAYPFSRPSIHMPRWASRIALEITNVRVERLQDISEEDAQAEGVPKSITQYGLTIDYENYREPFIELWDKINGKKHPWSSNPFVWVVEFKRV